jgi:hypothetical protein
MICKTCLTNKDANEFYASNKTKCKSCVKAAVNKHRQENLESIRAYDRMRGSMPHRVSARTEYQKTQAFAQSHKAAAERWAARRPERRHASYLVANAIRDGRLQKLPCLVCGEEKVEGHHPDYSMPLDVVWLCTSHHKEVHAMVKDHHV